MEPVTQHSFFARLTAFAAVCIVGVSMMLFTSATLSAQTAGAQPSPEQTMSEAETSVNLVSLDLLRFLGFYNLSYTRALTPAISITAQVETPTNFLLGSILNESGFGARIEGRYNFSQRNLVGIYVGPVIGFNSSTFRPGSAITGVSGSVDDFSATVTWIALGAMAGYQFAPFAGLPELLTGVGIGAEYGIVSATTSGSAPDAVPSASTVYPRIRWTIGYAWK